ncbi:ATP-binding protein [Paenibacillus sp. HWE-109]|uniref:sensor histidine kinase n=1 Tax=Paenibacillus sp. HWE-109 TaxID=1306526 RepID=UPI001EDF66A9|nr:ATP-binding protein [Paenibacillus sp. HWE-109]UKS29351.1 ATP-binding protein [Paenibacillus sp. HWE-109]
MNGLKRLQTKQKNGRWIAATIVCYLMLAVYIHIVSFNAPYLGIELGQSSSTGWPVESIDESGKAALWNIRPGDKIVAMDGNPRPKLIETDSGTLLTRAGYIDVEKQDGTRLEFRSTPRASDIVQMMISAGLEVMLLGIGVFAVRMKPESRIIRQFYMLNGLMALCVLSQFSDEKTVSELIIILCSIWLPHLLLSFYLLLVFRTVLTRFKKLLAGYLVYSIVLSLSLVYFIAVGQDVYNWVVNILNLTVVGTLLLLAGITFVYWKTFGRQEQNQLLVLFSGLFLSLLPYTFLYAIPILLGEEPIVLIKYTLIGLIPFSGAITYLLIDRSMLDIRLYFPRLLIHGMYLGSSFALFTFASKEPAVALYLLFVLFALLTFGYQKCLQRYRRKSQRQAEWLERQKLQLYKQLAEKGIKPHAQGDMIPYNRILLEAQQSERIRTTYYLHDHLLQNLIFLSRDLEELHDTGTADKEQIAVWLKCVYDSQRDIRTLCDDLYPHIIDKGDLKEALHWLMRTMQEKGDIRMELDYGLSPGEPANELIKTNLFRAIREIVHNAFKHSEATDMTIRLWMDRLTICCEIADNGKGFDIASVLYPSPEGERSFGLLSVHSQIRHLGGDTDIDSSPGNGTVVTIKLPLGTEAHAHA